jgi:16S rRNA (cytosine1402-N4)-methyltransferase
VDDLLLCPPPAWSTVTGPVDPVDPVDPRPFDHQPVMVVRVLELFAPVPAGTVVDATLGGGGHAAALLESRADLRILGLDQDPLALAAARARLAGFGERVQTTRARFDELATVVDAAGAAVQPIVGVLFDLGVSSPQFDRPERGFSYRHDGPLDMRMDPTAGPTAADLVNGADERTLAAILRHHADERFASRIARAVVAARPLRTTVALAEVVRDAIPAAARRRGGHPATRTFQALRIEVNNELHVLEAGLDAACDVTAPGGRILALSFHSGEDRIVKARFRLADDGGCTCPPMLPCACGASPEARLLRRGGWTPSADEQAVNRRAASAQLRAVEKLTFGPQDRP